MEKDLDRSQALMARVPNTGSSFKAMAVQRNLNLRRLKRLPSAGNGSREETPKHWAPTTSSSVRSMLAPVRPARE